MPTVTFNLEDSFYRALEEIGKRKGVSPHRVAKEIVMNHLLNLMLDTYVTQKAGNLMQSIYVEHKYPDIYVEHKYPDIYVEHKVQTYSSDISIGNKVEQDPDSEELVKRLETLERGVAELREFVNALAKEFKDFARRQQDLLNAYTSKTDQTLQRLSQLVEVLESLNEKLDKVAELFSKQQDLTKLSEEKPKTSAERSVKRRGVCEILEEQHVIFESDVAARIRDRNSFFASIESRCDDAVIECSRERVAVEKNFWQSFLNKVSKISTTDDEKIKRELDALEYRLFKILKESALLIFDTTKKQWVFVAQKSASTSASIVSTTSTSSKQHYKKRYEDDESWVLQYVDIG